MFVPSLKIHRYFDFLLLTVTIVITGLCYQKGMTISFSADDYPHLMKNIHFADVLDALSVFVRLDGREYRPIVRFSLWANYQMTHNATAFHWTNLILHLSSVVCLYFLFVLLLKCRLQAFFASLLFALHPIHSTNVFFILGRTDLFCGLFYLLSLLFFFLYWKQGQKRGYYVFSLIFFVLGLLSKEMSVSLPVLLFSMLMMTDPRAFRKRIFISLKQTSIYFMIACVYVAIRFYYWSDNLDSVSVYTNYDPLRMVKNLAMWLFALFYPFDLYSMRGLFESHTLNFLFVAFLIFLTLLAVIHFSMWPSGRVPRTFPLESIRKQWLPLLRNRTLHLSIVWFLVTLLPIIGGNAHRWYLYIPSVSVSFLLVALWQSARRKKIFHVFLLIFLISYPAELLKQSGIWKRQSEISSKFLGQIRDLNLDESKTYYFANMPFGYKSSFLFTFHSIVDATSFYFGFRPDIRVLSYVNLSDRLIIEKQVEGTRLKFGIQSDAYGHFSFPPAKRRFRLEDRVMNIQGVHLNINTLSPAGTVDQYEIHWPEQSLHFLYYFDGDRIQLFHRR